MKNLKKLLCIVLVLTLVFGTVVVSNAGYQHHESKTHSVVQNILEKNYKAKLIKEKYGEFKLPLIGFKNVQFKSLKSEKKACIDNYVSEALKSDNTEASLKALLYAGVYYSGLGEDENYDIVKLSEINKISKLADSLKGKIPYVAAEDVVLFNDSLLGVYSPVLSAAPGSIVYVRASWLDLSCGKNLSEDPSIKDYLTYGLGRLPEELTTNSGIKLKKVTDALNSIPAIYCFRMPFRVVTAKDFESVDIATTFIKNTTNKIVEVKVLPHFENYNPETYLADTDNRKPIKTVKILPHAWGFVSVKVSDFSEYGWDVFEECDFKVNTDGCTIKYDDRLKNFVLSENPEITE